MSLYGSVSPRRIIQTAMAFNPQGTVLNSTTIDEAIRELAKIQGEGKNTLTILATKTVATDLETMSFDTVQEHQMLTATVGEVLTF